jgi:hypothetical protein
MGNRYPNSFQPHEVREIAMPDVTQKILDLVRQRPNLTEREIAKQVIGPNAVQQDVNRECRALVSLGLVDRLGTGGPSDPYTYRALEHSVPAATFKSALRSADPKP